MDKRALGAFAALLLLGCQPSGGGGGPQPNMAHAQQQLGDAFMSAARAHTEIVNGDYAAATRDEAAGLRKLREAMGSAPVGMQQKLLPLEPLALSAQHLASQRNPAAMHASLQVMQGYFHYYDQLASAGGGAGTASPASQP